MVARYFSFHFFNSKSVSICTIVLIICCTFSCKELKEEEVAVTDELKLFTSVSSDVSKIDFVNKLEETLESNYYQYMYTYIGGGVAAGDINNDGLQDLYFTSNSSEDKLYLNQGNLRFKDITMTAGITINDGFNTGVTMVDINNDGFLDI